MRRLTLIAIILVFLAFLMSGCGNPAPPPTATPAPGGEYGDSFGPLGVDFGAMRGERITVLGTDYTKANPKDTELLRFYEQFQAEYGLIFEFISMAGDWRGKLAQGVITGNGITVLHADAGGFPSLPMDGLVQPVDSWINENDDTFSIQTLYGYTLRGKRYCLYPSKRTNIRGIVFNQTYFKNEGLASPLERYNQNGAYSWEELFEDSANSYVRGPNGRWSRWGYSLGAGEIAAAVALNGGEFWAESVENAQYKYTLNIEDDIVLDMLYLLQQARAEARIGFGRNQGEEDLLQNRCVFITADFERCINIQNTQAAKVSNTQFQTVPIPMGPNWEGEQKYALSQKFYMIGAESPNPEFGFAWVWHFSRDTTVPWKEEDKIPLTGKEYINSLPENQRYIAELYQEVRRNPDMTVAPRGLEGLSGWSELVGDMYHRWLRQGEKLTDVLNSMRPEMMDKWFQEEPAELEPPREPVLPPPMKFDDLTCVELSEGVRVEGDAAYMSVGIPGRVNLFKIKGKDITLAALNYYDITLSYRISGEVAQDGIRVGFHIDDRMIATKNVVPDGDRGNLVISNMTHTEQYLEHEVYLLVSVTSAGPMEIWINGWSVEEVLPPDTA